MNSQGQRIDGGSNDGRLGGSSERGRIEDVTDKEDANDEGYEERMEEEYAKREGGA